MGHYGRSMQRAKTLGELRASGWVSRPVKEELRANAIRRMAKGEALVANVAGYEDTVIPQLERALIAGHDVVFLGERGQAKTRMIRSLTDLLDEWMPIVDGSEIHDDPYSPVSRFGRDLVAERGDDTPIAWVHRDDRYAEKLATPDTSIADLIGEVDPIKVAEGRYLSDELTLHYGLVPRANRGIFAINELPDLAERIQVGLLNVLEERDVQIRGYRVRLPLDIVLFASANPDDYTNRGRLITPLKDRFGSQIRTHYPKDIDTEIDIVETEAQVADAGVEVEVPDFMAEIVVLITHLARQSPRVNQRSGVSVRLSIANYEALVAAAIRRAIRAGETRAVPRIVDLDALEATGLGKIEFDSLDGDRDHEIFASLVSMATLDVFRSLLRPEQLTPLVASFDEGGRSLQVGASMTDANYLGYLEEVPELRGVLLQLGFDESDLSEGPLVASGIEFVLEGLHLARRLNKYDENAEILYSARADN